MRVCVRACFVLSQSLSQKETVMRCTPQQQAPLNNKGLVYAQHPEQEGHLVVTAGQRAEEPRIDYLLHQRAFRVD